MSEKIDFLKKLESRLASVEKDSLYKKLYDACEDRLLFEEACQRLDEGMVLLDAKAVPFFVNRRAEIWLGISPRDLFKRPIWSVLPDGPLAAFLRTNLPAVTAHAVHRFKILAPREADLRLTMIPTEHRQGLLLVLADVTERTEQEFETALIERMESLVRLAGGIAHEIGNPLNAITIHLELLKKQLRGLPDPKKKGIESSLSDIQAETKRLDRIIRNFLKATRKPPLRFRLDSLNEVISDAISFLRPELDAARVKLKFSRENALPPFMMDRERLYYAFINLIKNALESMPKGGDIRVSVTGKDNCAVISITDSGCGIPEENLPRIFDIYYTTKPEGSGLGLMMVYDAVKEHGGKIEVSSKVGKGTTFRILLPVREPQLQLPNYSFKGGAD